jgi:hypothetical protein
MFGLFPLILRTDDAIESAWRDRDWKTLVKFWLTATVVVAVGSIVSVYAIGFLFLQGTRVFYFFKRGGDVASELVTSAQISSQLSGLWDFALAFGAVTAAMGLLHAVLAVMVRKFAGHKAAQ